MDDNRLKFDRQRRVWLQPDAGSVAEFERALDRETRLADWPFATEIASKVLIYDGDAVRTAEASGEAEALMAEWADVFAHGPGVIVIRNAMPDTAVVDRATEIYTAIIDEERRTGGGGGDHFAKPGANDRVWNSLQKHCMADPGNYVAYWGNTCLDLASRAWLGDGYQMTGQVNRVNPGGAAQVPHRDYHLGFMTPERLRAFPAHVHDLSPALTLQGAIAHVDMPVETGPTVILPCSQDFHEGYVAFAREEFREVFARRHVQLPLKKGDMMFFNPATMHGAGTNHSTDVQRMANLVQVGSAFGRSIEAVDTDAMCRRAYAALASGIVTGPELRAAIACTAEGYAFPTNLDTDPPVGGLAPKSQQQILTEALERGATQAELDFELDALKARRKP